MEWALSPLPCRLAGRPPWVRRRLSDILASVICAAAVVLPKHLRPGLPEPSHDLCRKCLFKMTEQRYHAIEELRSSLTRLTAS